MSRMSFVLSVILTAWTAGNSRADLLPLFNNVPAEYIPGTPFTFQIVLPDLLSSGSPMNGLSAFQVGLVFDASVDNPILTVNAAMPSSGYVFPGSKSFSNNPFSGPGSNEVSVNFSDSIAPNYVTVGPGQDILANIIVDPDISLTGPITVSFQSNTLITYFSEGFDETPPSVTIDQGFPPPPAVPTPAAWLSMAIGAGILMGRNRLLKRA